MLNQFELVDQILTKLNKYRILEDIIIVGSWCIYFYKHHFKDEELPGIRTTDIDINVNLLRKSKISVNIPEILKPLDFEIDFHGEGAMSLIHSFLTIDFFVPDTGSGIEGFVNLPGLGVNASPLRYMEMLEKETITIDYKGMMIRVPDPARFSVHKLIISQRRGDMKKTDETGITKTNKDIIQGIEVMGMLYRRGEIEKVLKIIDGRTKKQKNLIKKAVSEDKIRGEIRLLLPEKEQKEFYKRVGV